MTSPSIQLPVERDNVSSAWHLFPIRLDLDKLTIDRSGFIDQLAERNIGSSVHFIPLHLHPFYRDRYGFYPSNSRSLGASTNVSSAFR